MFINARVNHKKFGPGVVENLELNPIEEIKSKVVVKFDSGKISKFIITSFGSNGFFTTDDKEIIPYINKLEKEHRETMNKKLEEECRKIKHIPVYHLDEIEKEVTKENWERAYKVAESYRFPNESRAVIMDSDLVFINASAAMKYMDARIKDCDKIYKACENGKKFLGSHWKYANRECIKHIIESFNSEE